jgi:hypothetical protein
MSIEFNDKFKLPIFYNEKKVSLKSHIINDLELVETIDPECNPMYNMLFNHKINNNDSADKQSNLENENIFAKSIIPQVSEFYTTDTDFLKDNQKLIKSYNPLLETKTYQEREKIMKNMIEIWKDVKDDTGFKNKYYYMDWEMLEFLNKSDYFLQFMSIYNLASPIISLFLPIIVLIVPFFIIKIKGLTLTFNDYYEILKKLIANHAIGKLFTQFNDVDMNQKIYILVSSAFYIFSIYQNVLTCLRFNNNMKKIHQHFKDINEYLEYTISNIKNYLVYSYQFTSHQKFNDILTEKMETLKKFKSKIDYISEYKINYQKVMEIGHILKTFYELYDDEIYNDTFLYSFGFNGYIECIIGLKKNIEERKVNSAQFLSKKEKKKNIIKNNYYAVLKDDSPVKNDIKFNKNIIITGPNASGKTTILKSTLINIIFTQQFGFGFYDSAKLFPYSNIHCYLNIPDTSGRDSLFQAEARRCKDILDCIKENEDETHICAFDELYSGTNPDEAVTSATAFMNYLVKNNNVSCLLTTHFTKVCKNLKKNKVIENYHMKTENKDANIKYIYKLEKGISTVKGGINVLTNMNYPKEIIDNTSKNL